MELEHSFTVPAGVGKVWDTLCDLRRIVPCMPGAILDSVDGENVAGRLRVKIGTAQITYRGEASLVEVDDAAHRAVIEARGGEARGSGTADAKITAQLATEGDGTRVDVTTELTVTGRAAQLRRGAMADAGERLIGRFADCLTTQLADEAGTVGASAHDASGATIAGGAVTGAEPVNGADAPGETEGGAVPTDGQLAGAGVPASGATGAPMPDMPDMPESSGSSRSPAFTSSAEPSGPSGAPGVAFRPSDETINLLDVAGSPMLRRAAAVAAAVAAVIIIWRLRRD
jgi:carbon monoxide dehydrogenase subunit G